MKREVGHNAVRAQYLGQLMEIQTREAVLLLKTYKTV